jgi:RNA polymerase sigma factor (sigma-70 family)
VAVRRRNGGDNHFPAMLAAARAGEPWAFAHFYASLAPAVGGLFRMHGAAEPDDLTSEVFVGVLRNVEHFDGDEASFRSWVFTIAYRRLADERRHRARRPPAVPMDELPDTSAADDVADDAERSLATERVRALCERLRPAQREVLLLRLVGLRTVEEVATTLGRSPGAVKALQRRGLAAIAQVLEREGATPDRRPRSPRRDGGARRPDRGRGARPPGRPGGYRSVT